MSVKYAKMSELDLTVHFRYRQNRTPIEHNMPYTEI